MKFSVLLTLIIAVHILNTPHLAAQEQDYDFVVNSDGAWTWFNDERALIKDGRLYSSYVTSQGYVGLSVHDLESNKGINSPIHLSSWTEPDDHNNASLLFREDGKLMAFYAKHHTDKFTNYRVSLVEKPESLTDWGPEIVIQSGTNHTYNNAFQLASMNGTIYNFSRTNGYNPNWKKYSASGKELSADTEFIRSGDDKTRPYVKYASNGKDRIDFFFTNGHPRKTDNNLYHMYFKGGSLYQTDGKLIMSEAELPITVDQVDKFYTFGDKSPTARPWTSSFNYSNEGHPVVTYSLQEDKSTIDYYYAYWNDTDQTWEHHYIADAGDALYDAERDYTGLVALNPHNTNEIFMSSNVNPISNKSTPHYEMYRGLTSDMGETWCWTVMTSDSKADNIRPFVPKGEKNANHVVLWLKGTYNTYTDFSTKVVGRYIRHVKARGFSNQQKKQPDGRVNHSWKFEQADLWEENGSALILKKPGQFLEKIRRPSAVAYLDVELKNSFSFSAQVKCTDVLDSGRDVILVFGYQSPQKYYYAHLSNDNTIMAHNGIFIVDGADRRRIDTPGLSNPPPTRMNDMLWHDVRIDRNTTTGSIEVFLDNLQEPLMKATDYTFQAGKVGFGSFDNTGEIRNIEIYDGRKRLWEVDNFDQKRSGNINGQSTWNAGPPGATDGARVTPLSPKGITGKSLEINSAGVQYRGNAAIDLSEYEISATEDITTYFETVLGKDANLTIAFATSNKPPIEKLNSTNTEIAGGLVLSTNGSSAITSIKGGVKHNMVLAPEVVYQHWLVRRPSIGVLEWYYRLKSSANLPAKVSIPLSSGTANKIGSIFIYNNDKIIPKTSSYFDNIYIAKGKHLGVPIINSDGSGATHVNVTPILNPFEKTVPLGDLKLKMREIAEIPASDAKGDVKARINYLTHAGDGSKRLFVNDLRNYLYLVHKKKVSVYLPFKDYFEDFVDAPRLNSGFGFVAFHPDFKSNGKFYTIHTEAGNALKNKTPEYETSLNTQVHGVLTEWTAKNPRSNTFKGTHRELLRVGFSTLLHGIQAINFNPTAKKGTADHAMLYISMGDGEENPNQTSRPQSLATHEAKIFRIDPTGSNSSNGNYGIPEDNPFIDKNNALPEIWALGIRNPHRMSWDPNTGKMFFSMIGENKIDAIYEGIKGANYGWNNREGAFVFDRENPMYVTALPKNDKDYNYTYPIIQLDHDDSKALIGGYVYNGKRIPELKGKYLFGDIVYGPLFYTDATKMKTGASAPPVYRVQLFNEKNEPTTFVKEVSHYYRADLKFGQDEAGEIYLLSKTNGKIYILERMD